METKFSKGAIKTTLFTFLLLWCSSFVYGQNEEKQIAGRWTVVKAEISIPMKEIPKDQRKKMEQIKDMFLNSVFEFLPDHHFNYNINTADLKVKNGHWKYSPKSKSYIMQEWNDRNADKPILMEIFVKHEGKTIYFLLEESPFVLTVQHS